MSEKDLMNLVDNGNGREIMCLMQEEDEEVFDRFIGENTQVVILDGLFCNAGFFAGKLREEGISCVVCCSITQLAGSIDSLNKLLIQLFHKGIEVYVINYGFSLGPNKLQYSEFLDFQEQMKAELASERVITQRQYNYKRRLQRELESEEFLAVFRDYEEGRITQKQAARMLSIGLTTFRGRLEAYRNKVD